MLTFTSARTILMLISFRCKGVERSKILAHLWGPMSYRFQKLSKRGVVAPSEFIFLVLGENGDFRVGAKLNKRVDKHGGTSNPFYPIRSQR
jgi:hypothetical protein